MISAHGGYLINKIFPLKEKEKILNEVNKFKTLVLDEEEVQDVKNIATGVYSPLEGFLKEGDFKRVISENRLTSGVIWSIPIVLDISKEDAKKIKNEKETILIDKNKEIIGLLKNTQIYPYDKKFFVKNIFGTLDRNHPGVEEVYKMEKYLIGGEVFLLDNSRGIFPEYNFTPKETQKIFQKKGWKSISAFQTRNIPHRGHEFLQKQVLKEIDGLFIQPVIGKKKLNDFKDEFILASYEILINRYYPKEKVFLGILPLKMRYAGPREALFHALIRKNFGCTHFIIGRGHAGMGNYYPPYAAQKIFEQFDRKEVGIEILKFPEVVFCTSCKKHIFINSCLHPAKDKIHFSGTKIRKEIENKKIPPFYLIRPEIYWLLSQGTNPLVDTFYRRENLGSGFCLWFTGLPQAGKTTIADRVYNILKEKGIKTERLDGDIVRQSLTKDLGFTKEDRDENLRRVGNLAQLFCKRGTVIIASFVSPYRSQREGLRKEIPNFVEVFVNCPLEICIKRDKKGLYQKALKGGIRNFTGISDLYEEPEDPDLELKTDLEIVEESAQKVINYLIENNYIPENMSL